MQRCAGDGARRLIAFNDDSGGTSNSRIVFAITAGRTYYVRAAGFEESTGGYLLSAAFVGYIIARVLLDPKLAPAAAIEPRTGRYAQPLVG